MFGNTYRVTILLCRLYSSADRVPTAAQVFSRVNSVDGEVCTKWPVVDAVRSGEDGSWVDHCTAANGSTIEAYLCVWVGE